MGQEEALRPAPAMDAVGGMPEIPRKAPATVFLSWEQEPAGTKPASAPTVKPRSVPEGPRKAQAPTRPLSVRPPPCRQASKSASRAVRPEYDPFLAAYLACTKSTRGRGDNGRKKRATGMLEPKKGQGQRRFAWVDLGLGGLSCMRDNEVVEQSMMRLAKLPEQDLRDA